MRRRDGWGLLAVLGGVLVGLPALAGTLKGTVVGNSGAPKRFVRVEVLGPEKEALFTGQDGTFTVEVPEGSYSVRITERNRRMEFEDVQVPGAGHAAETFQVEW
ncbi:hypothetical protein Q664_44195 [Archangium violaceum Cb vi76]|uniref:Carboxypeptidase regulatory-like domain-containing protein n=1 Tax=Archangium violaceum Cb vi76 TaxID=1406225 RepID=A0A084SHP4_9BACT|nr:hypothetical protein Q664_44195 [Archangium violaceum Cb vi76]